MTDTIEPVKLDDDENEQIARTMVAAARACGVDLVGPDGLLAGLTKQVLELALEEELTDHLGYPPGEREAKTGTNERNRSRPTTVITEIGPGADRRAARPRGLLRAGDRSQAAAAPGGRRRAGSVTDGAWADDR